MYVCMKINFEFDSCLMYIRTYNLNNLTEYHTQENFGGEKFGRTIQVKAISKEKFGK